MRKRLSAIVTRQRHPDPNNAVYDPPTHAPPPVVDAELHHVIAEIKDWQITHGSLLKLVRHEEPNTVPVIPVGAAVYPTTFPRQCFEDACALQVTYNKLYSAVSEDHEWLEDVLKELIGNDALTSALWDILCEARHDRDNRVKHAPCSDLTLGIFRSDYMLHSSRSLGAHELPLIKQVELNTYSCAGGIHGTIVADMHRHLIRKGLCLENREGWPVAETSSTPANPTLSSIVSSLKSAHEMYVQDRPADSPPKCVLMVVQPNNINICDERPIEYGLWDQNVPTFRVVFGLHLLERTTLSESQLIYIPEHPSSNGQKYQVSVVYMRAGYDEAEYTPIGKDARLRIEMSNAIKCPSVSSHLSTLKVVQQALTKPGALERFLTPEQVATVRQTFMPIYPLDDSPEGQRAQTIASDSALAMDYVLKPSLEGGGHNVYRKDVPEFLARTPKTEWTKYVLMEMITPPALQGTLVSPIGIHDGQVVSELGIFGTCLWRSSRSGERDDGRSMVQNKSAVDFLFNEQAGWSFKTKSRDVEEMSVVKGYGCFDSPLLIPTEAWLERYG